MNDLDYPMAMQLDALLSGEHDVRVQRPPIPHTNPRHDLYGPRPVARSIEDMLGAEHFTRPEPEKVPQRMYSIGELGKVLGRKAGTIRMWIRTGVIPEADHWTAGDRMSHKRQFTHQQVMGLLSIASSEGLLGAKPKDIGKTGFSARAFDLWRDLA